MISASLKISSFKKNVKSNVFALLFILAISIFTSFPLLRPGLHSIHDDQQVARLYLYDSAIKDGQMPPRIVSELGFGFGYPLFVFYPPMVYMLGEVVHQLGFNFVNSIKIVFFLSILLSGYAMYFFVKKYLGNLAATLSALFWVLLPYRAIDVYVRGALSEAFAFVWVPIVFMTFLNLAERQNRKNVATCAVAISGLLLTHNLIFIAMTVMLPFIVAFSIYAKKNKYHIFLSLLTALFFACLLTAFFWLPSLLEKNKTIVDQILLTELASYSIHFVYPQQLWNSAWGFGGSAAGDLDGLSFKVGKLHILSSLFALVLVLLHKFYSPNKNYLQSKKQNQLTLLMTLVLVLSVFMTTKYSNFVWETIEPLAYLQFPWRFLILVGFASSVLCGAVVFLLRITILKICFFVIAMSLLLFTNLKLFKPQTTRDYFNDDNATSEKILNWDVSRSSFEYLPKGIAVTKGSLNTTVIDIDESEIPKHPINILSGDGNIRLVTEASNVVSFSIRSSNGATIRINKTNFPRWEVKIDEKVTNFNDNNKFKLIEFKVNPGEHTVIAQLKNTTPRTVGNLTSIIALISLVPILRWKKK